MNIIFDLDGTLIDSSKGILNAVDLAFQQCTVELQQPLTPNLIGPPLTQLLPLLSGTDDPKVIAQLSDAFKEGYDMEGYKKTEIFEGVSEMLELLFKKGCSLYIATNKRIIPTRKIIDFFAWTGFFQGIYALDMFDGLATKAELIERVISLHNMDDTPMIYVGDTVADRSAAKANDVAYIMVSWGYDFEERTNEIHVDTVKELKSYILELS